jgi:hypothetical protein
MSEAGARLDPRLISYLTLRKAVGFLGILLPFMLAVGDRLIFGGGLQQSVSDYYYTGMRGVLVGGLCVIGAFLLAYHGYNGWDRLFTGAAGIGAIGVALFPTRPAHPSFRATVAGYLHFASGTVLFVSLAVIALWLFRKTAAGQPRSRVKRIRDIIYLVCGIAMIAALALAGLASLPFAAGLSPLHPVFWMEATATAAFGVAWLVKGQAVLRDRPAPSAAALRREPGAHAH